jgi:hypothetical protein
MGKQILKYQSLAILAVASMSCANKAARGRMAVDVLSLTRLLLTLSATRYQAKKEEAWNWKETLPPYCNKLKDNLFKNINFRHYKINRTDGDKRWECKMSREGKGHSQRTCYFMKLVIVPVGFHTWMDFCDMVAVVRSYQIEGLTPTSTMPHWWMTDCWRSQYPLDTYVTCDFDMEALRGTPEDTGMRYCPPYTMARATGHPKIDK